VSEYCATSMAMSMTECFYGASEPNYIVDYSRHTPNSSYYNNETGHQQLIAHGNVVPVLELMVPICCTKCEQKVRELLLEVKGVSAVMCDQYNLKVTVIGNVDPLRALKKAKQVKRKSEFWTGTPPHTNQPAHN
jgi:copper chaperone CopZ